MADDVIDNGDRRALSFALGTWSWTCGVSRRDAAIRLPGFLGRGRRALSRPRRRRVDALLLGQRTASVHRALPRARRTADSQDRSLGRGQEHAHPRVGGRQGARAFGIDISEPTVTQARAAFDARLGRRCGRGRPTCARCPSATRASTRSTRWARSSTSTKPSAPSKRWLACSSPAGAPSSACRTGTIRFSGRCSRRCSRRSDSTGTGTRSPTHAAH